MELNIAVIGCGMIGREHIERIQNRIRGAKVVAVCDVFEEGAKKGAEIAGAGTKVYTDFNQAINDPDVNAVVVTGRVPQRPGHRRDQGRQAGIQREAAGKHRGRLQGGCGR